MGSEGLPYSSRLFRPQVLRHMLLPLIQLAEIFLLVLVDDSQDSGDVLPKDADFGEFRRGTTSNFGHSEVGQLLLQVIQLFQQLFLLLSPQVLRLDFGHFSPGCDQYILDMESRVEL